MIPWEGRSASNLCLFHPSFSPSARSLRSSTHPLSSKCALSSFCILVQKMVSDLVSLAFTINVSHKRRLSLPNFELSFF